MDSVKVKTLSEKLEALEKQIPVLTQKDELISSMLERMLRPFLIALSENNKRLSPGVLSVGTVIQQVLETFAQNPNFPSSVAEAVKERYAVVPGQQLDWVKEITYTTSQYNHPLSKLRDFVFKNLSPEGQAVVAMKSLQAIS